MPSADYNMLIFLIRNFHSLGAQIDIRDLMLKSNHFPTILQKDDSYYTHINFNAEYLHMFFSRFSRRLILTEAILVSRCHCRSRIFVRRARNHFGAAFDHHDSREIASNRHRVAGVLQRPLQHPSRGSWATERLRDSTR